MPCPYPFKGCAIQVDVVELDLNFPVWKIGSSSPQEDKSKAGAFPVGSIVRDGEKKAGRVEA